MRKYGGKTTIVVTVLIAVVTAAAIYGGFRYNKVITERLAALTGTEQEEGITVPTYTAKIYFADEQYEELVAEKRELAKPEDPEDGIKQVIEELIKGPDADDHGATIPKKTKLLSVFLDDDVALLNFDAQIRSETYGTTGEMFLVNSVYRTVTENVKDAKGVQIMVEGSKGPTLYGDEGMLYTGVPRRSEVGKVSKRN